jgi:hypothetical protein
MSLFRLTGLLALLVPALLSCGSAERGKYHGSLYYGQGNYLMQFSLGDGSVVVVDNLGDRTIRGVSDLGGDKLLIAETAWIRNRSVPRISWFDLDTGQSSVLYSGVHAVYLAEAGVIAYDDGSKLYAVPQLGAGSDEIVFSHGRNELSTLMAVSGHLLLFETVISGQPVIHSWSALTGELLRLEALSSACRLGGAVWIGSVQRLACKEGSGPSAEADYLLAGLDGTVSGRLHLPGGKRFMALAWLPGQDAVILSERWQGTFGTGDKSAVWIYDVRQGTSHRLARHLDLGNSVVYADS